MNKLPNDQREFNIQVDSFLTSLRDNVEGGDDKVAMFMARRLREYVEDVHRERPGKYMSGMQPMQYLKKITTNV
jgi:hypothetical protein